MLFYAELSYYFKPAVINFIAGKEITSRCTDVFTCRSIFLSGIYVGLYLRQWPQ